MIGQQMTIPQLTAHMSYNHTAIGVAGEVLVARTLEGMDFQVTVSHYRGDLTVVTPDGQIVYIEVKTARRAKDGVYRFTLWKRWQGRQCADHHRSDVVILLCVLKTGDAIPFVVPTPVLGNRHSVGITSFPADYRGWLVPYRQTLRTLSLPE